jgi:hypothetical protein
MIRILFQALLRERARKKEMRFMKKFLSLACVAVLGIGLAAGCKPKETTTTTTTEQKTEAPAVVQETGTTATATTGTATTATTTTATTTTATTTETPKK